MGISRIASAVFCGLTLLLVSRPAATQDSGAVLAEINGQKVTTAELDQKEGGMLLQARTQYYEAQRKALEELIDQKLLEAAAARDHITVDQLLQREVNSKVTDPTDDQMRVFYEAIVDTKEPYESLRGKILDHIRQTRRTKLQTAYMEKLRKDAKIQITLEPPKADVAVENNYVLGRKDAPVMLVEFADYQCPYCQKVNSDLQKLSKEFSGKVAIAYKDFPLPMHPNAQKSAEAARCAGVQGKFWEYHDLLFTDKKLEVADLKAQARTLNLDTARFDKCLDSGEQAAAVKKDQDAGTRLGLSGTPSFFVNGHFYSGAFSYEALRQIVQQYLPASLSTANVTTPKESSLR